MCALAHPIDVRRTLSPIQRGPADPAFQRRGDEIWRASRMPTGPVTVRLLPLAPDRVEAVAWGPGAAEHLETLPRLLGAERSLDGLRPDHPVVADALRRFPGVRLAETRRPMEALIPAVLEQKVLGVDAFASWRRLLHRHGEPAPGPAPERMRLPLEAEAWAALPSWEWHRAGVDPARYRTAQRAARHGASLERLVARGTEPTPVYRALRSIPGIGVWTAAEVGSRALGDLDAVPFGDYHLGNLVGVGLVGERLTDDTDIAAALEPFRPYRGLVVRWLQLSPLVRVERRGPRMSRIDYRRI